MSHVTLVTSGDLIYHLISELGMILACRSISHVNTASYVGMIIACQISVLRKVFIVEF
jgi:hypothetical protein